MASSLTALIPQQPAYAAIPTNQADCSALGGTWTSNFGLCSNLSKVATMPLIDQARSFADLNGLYDCFTKSSAQSDDIAYVSTRNRITAAHVKSGSWWATTGSFSKGQTAGAETAGSYLNAKTPADHGNTLCNDVLADALKTWGFSDGVAFMCSIKTNVNNKAVTGIPRADGSSCQTGGGEDWNLDGYADDMWASVKSAVYGGREPNWAVNDGNVNAAKYLLYRNAFLVGCSPKVSSTGIGDRKYSKIIIVTDAGVSSTKDYEGLSSGTQRDVYRQKGYKTDSETCANIAKSVNKFAPDFIKYLKSNPDDRGSTIMAAGCVAGTTDAGGVKCVAADGATSCVIEGIGWLVCASMNAISGVVDGLYGLIQGILTINPLQQKNDDGTASAQYATWQNIRNIANILLVIGFLVIIFSQLTSMGVSNYGIKKMMPRIIIVAIAINLSYFIMGAAIDITNILGTSIKTILDTSGTDATLSSVSAEKITQAYLTGATTITLGTTLGIVAIGAAGLSASALALMAFPFLLGAFLAVLAAFATMFIRNALIIVLVVIAPVAFAAYLLPNTQSLFERWRKLFISMLVLFPLAALLFGGARLAAYITLSSKSDFSVIIALFIMAAPLGALPFLIKSSNSLLSGINNKLQSAAKSARGATQRGLKPFVDKQKAQYQAGERNFLGRRQRPGSGRNLAQGFDQRRRSRTLETQNAGTNAEENWKEAGVTGTSRAGQRAQRALDTQKTLGTRKSANEAQIEERSKRRIADSSTIDSTYERQSFDAQKGSSTAEATTKQNNLQRVRDNEVSTSAAAGGERLGNIERQRFGSEEASKTLELQMKRANMESGIAAGSVQAQKTAELGIKAVDAEEQAEFDGSVQHNDDTIATTQRADAASRLSGAATAETKQMLDEQADSTLELRKADERKQNAEFVSASIAGNNKTALAQEQQVGGALFDSVITNASNSKQQEALGKQSDQLIAEAVTNSDAPHLDVIDDQARAILQQATENTRIATSATDAANRVATQEHADNLINSPVVAQNSGGIDPSGQQRVVAQATEAQRKARGENVAAARTTVRAQARTGQDLENILTTGTMDSQNITAEQEEAVIREMWATNDQATIARAINYIGSDAVTAMPEHDRLTLQQAFAEAAGQSPAKPKSLGGAQLGALSRGEFTGSADDITVALANSGKLPMESIASLDNDETLRMVHVLSGEEVRGPGGNILFAADTPRVGEVTQENRAGFATQIHATLNDPVVRTKIEPRQFDRLMQIAETLSPGSIARLDQQNGTTTNAGIPPPPPPAEPAQPTPPGNFLG